tara:strand:+ start:45243 stop:45548 length:306 start_codon:yes stop_codon:yes gene_type:complete
VEPIARGAVVNVEGETRPQKPLQELAEKMKAMSKERRASVSLVAVQTVVRSRMLKIWRSTEELVLRRWNNWIPARIRAKLRGILISSASLKLGHKRGPREA